MRNSKLEKKSNIEYQKIIDYCKDKERLSDDISNMLGAEISHIQQVLHRMLKMGFLEATKIPYRGQSRNLYRVAKTGQQLLDKRVWLFETKEQRALEKANER